MAVNERLMAVFIEDLMIPNLYLVLCQYPVAVAMDGANVHSTHPSNGLLSKDSADVLRGAFFEFLGGFLGEGKSDDRFRYRTITQNFRDTPRYGLCLSGPRARNYLEVARDTLDDSALP